MAPRDDPNGTNVPLGDELNMGDGRVYSPITSDSGLIVRVEL